MISAYHAIREKWVQNPQIADMRSAAFVVAIKKVGSDYENMGVFP